MKGLKSYQQAHHEIKVLKNKHYEIKAVIGEYQSIICNVKREDVQLYVHFVLVPQGLLTLTC